MRRIVLKKLRIENFKGCRERRIDFGRGTDIYGANASGKTTIFDAFTWLLFDKDSAGATKFNIRPLDASGKMVDNVEILVEAVLDVDGENITLQKKQKQVWTKKRGTDTVKFQGNSNEYEINGFPASEAEFKAKIASIITEELFKLLTDPRAFAALPWKKQREILLKFISEITDADVLATDSEKYAPIADELQAASVEKIIEKSKKTMSKLKERQKELPARIDEANKALVDVPELADLELQRNALNEKLVDVQKQRDDAGEAYKAVGELQDEILKTKLEISGAEQAAVEALDKRRREATRLHSELQSRGYDLFNQRKRKEEELKQLQSLVEKKEKERADLVEQWRAAKNMVMDESETVCSYCGQTLPADKIEKIRADFEKNKADAVEDITAKGNAAKQQIETTNDLIAKLEAEIANLKQQWDDNSGETAKAYEAMNAIPAEPDLHENQEYKALQDKLRNLESQLGSMDSGASVKQQLSIQERYIREELDGVNRQFAAVEANERTWERIEELKAEQRNVGQQVADQEQKIDLLEAFSRVKMEMLSSGINGQFQVVNFKLFEMQINGGTKPTCEMTVNGVPYSSLNSAGKLQAGLDVIAALSRLYDVSAPIWIDNAEGLNDWNVPQMSCQMILLKVTDDEELVIKT